MRSAPHVASALHLLQPHSYAGRGPIWVNANAVLAHAMNKNGRPQQASALADAVVNLLAADLAHGGQWHEAYDGDTGEALAAPGFLSWDVLGATSVIARSRRGETLAPCAAGAVHLAPSFPSPFSLGCNETWRRDVTPSTSNL